MMRSITAFSLSLFAMLISPLSASAVYADETDVHCKIDELAFDGDPDITHADYVIPSGGQPTLRLSVGHNDRTTGSIRVELKARGVMAAGTTPVSKESIVKLLSAPRLLYLVLVFNLQVVMTRIESFF
jgi:hypothetical protein